MAYSQTIEDENDENEKQDIDEQISSRPYSHHSLFCSHSYLYLYTYLRIFALGLYVWYSMTTYIVYI